MEIFHRTIALLLISVFCGLMTSPTLMPHKSSPQNQQDIRQLQQAAISALNKNSCPAECTDSSVSVTVSANDIPCFYIAAHPESSSLSFRHYTVQSHIQTPLLPGSHIKTTILRL